MSVSAVLRGDLDFLSKLSSDQESVEIDSNTKCLVKAKKKSRFQNFLSWMIYWITCKHAARNAKLDAVAERVLNKAQEINAHDQLTENEKFLFGQAFINLDQIIQKNGGRDCSKKIHHLLKTIKKIPIFDPEKISFKKSNCHYPSQQVRTLEQGVLDIQNPSSLAEIHERVHQEISNSQRLKLLLENIEAGLEPQAIAEKMAPLFLEVEADLDLSDDLTPTLCMGLKGLSKEWIQENAKKLSTDLIRLLVEKAFLGPSELFIPFLFEALVHEPIDIQRLSAWIHGLPVYQPELRSKGEYLERILDQEWKNQQFPNHESIFWEAVTASILEHSLTPEVLESFEKFLPKEEMKFFIYHFFGLIAVNQSLSTSEDEFNESFLGKALALEKNFSKENWLFLLETLLACRSIDDLSRILKMSQCEDHLIEKIIELNPYEEPYDHFFIGFTRLLIEEEPLNVHLPNLISYVFKTQSIQRKKELFNQMPLPIKLQYLEDIPLLELDLPNWELNELFKKIFPLENEIRDQKLSILAPLFEHNLQDESEIEAFINKTAHFRALLPFFSLEMQNYLLAYVRNTANHSNDEAV